MGLFDFIRNQFIDIVEWPDETPDVLVHRFEREDHEIKNGAKLIVRPGQAAVFVNEGRIADQFEPGTYVLSTSNLPILTNLLSLPTGFESWHKVEVYFIKTTEQLNRSWGTKQPIMMRDADFGMLRIRGFGNYSYRVGRTDGMLERFVGARAEFKTLDIEPQFSMRILSEFSDALGEMRIPALDLASKYVELGDYIRQTANVKFQEMGFELTSFTVGNIALPQEVNEAIDKRGALGALGGAMGLYTQKQAADAMVAAANNEGVGGGMAGMMVGGMMGGMMGQQVMQQQHGMMPQGAAAGGAMPPPLPIVASYYLAVNGQRLGPYGLHDLSGMVAGGMLRPETLVWTAGMADWQEARTVAGLQSLFNVPPAVPT